MNVDDIRETFIHFYTERGHMRIPSASLVPHGDPTLLFTSAGMVPFKPYFMGLAEAPAPRMCTVQKCFRTTDIEEVGDYSHLTLFEMLGNFSVGDYFKEEAIHWAWELLTEGFKLPKDKLWISIFLTDDEAHGIWRRVGVPEERIHRYPEENNYWFSGEVGPCGPNSEIFVDRGPRAATCDFCRVGTCKPNLEPDCGRFLEVWNLVFMTLYQAEDGSRTELPRKNIDTGSGLERMACILQGKDTVYETDVFIDIIASAAAQAGKEYGRDPEIDHALRVVAEHTRAATFLIADGVLPSNEGRGYVLRRILRRAMYFLIQIADMRGSAMLPRVADAVVRKMGVAYPELSERHEFIRRLLEAEENKYKQALQRGRLIIESMLKARVDSGARLEEAVRFFLKAGLDEAELPHILTQYGVRTGGDLGIELAAGVLLDGLRQSLGQGSLEQALHDVSTWRKWVTGREAFVLSDTFGIPFELTQEEAAKYNVSVNRTQFDAEMAVQRERGRAAAKFDIDADRTEAYRELAHIKTAFVGYDKTRHETTVAGIIGPLGVQESADAGEAVEVVLIETPFYPEGGGQAGDTGEIVKHGCRVAVDDTQSSEGLIVHRGRVVEGRIAVNDAVTASADVAKRRASQRNHTATHLLHAALRQVLGDHVRQAGSLVAPDRLRFDFTHIEATKAEEIAAAQRLVNEKIREDIEVHWEQMPYDEAVAGGAMALFGEKYTANVRVVGICEPETIHEGHEGVGEERAHARCFSTELCGGTHCGRTGEIGAFVIVSESSVGSGLRRIEALTGPLADAYVLEQQATLARVGRRLNAAPAEIEARVEALQMELEAERRRLQQLERQVGRGEADALVTGAEKIGDASLVVARVTAASVEALREMGDVLREKLGSAVIVLGAVIGDRPNFLVVSTKDLNARVHAGNLVKQIAAVAGGGGGGRPDMAQAGGKDASKLDEALDLARRVAREALGS
jgi:alanyl-tRNA synthetase